MFSSSPQLKGTKTNVAIKLTYDDTENRFLVGYGPGGIYTQTGRGETVSDALLEIAENINDTNQKASADCIKELQRGKDISVNIFLRSNGLTEYIAVIKDGETTITGEGRSTDRAFRALGEKKFTVEQ